MNCSQAAGLLWLLAAAAFARDPFAPPESANCLGELPGLTQWRLQGIIGREHDYRGWLRSPQGKSVAVRADSPFPLYPWQVGKIDQYSISLQVAAGCVQGQFSLRLKGRAYEKDSHRPAVVADKQQPGR